MRSFSSLLLASLLLASGCDGTVSVTFATGPQEFEVSTAPLELPAELEDASSGTIAMVPCGSMGMCPPSDAVTLTCEAGFCDPAPKTISVPVGSVLDVDALLADTRDILRVVDSYTIEEITYDIQLNTMTVPTEEIEVYWGPEAATAIDESMMVRRFGTVPSIAAGSTGVGDMIVDAAGVAALSDYLVEGNGRVRFFARTQVDLDPGDPFPRGSVRVAVNATIRAVGGIVD